MHGRVLNSGEIRPENFDPEIAPHPGREHFGARLDRHPKDIAHARGVKSRVHLRHEFFPGHSRSPLREGLEGHDRFEHRERRWIGGGLCLPCFAEDGLHFRKLLQLPVLDLQDSCRLIYRHPWHGGRHVEHCAFVERRHEFLPEFQKRKDCQREEERRTSEHQPPMMQHESHCGFVKGDQESVNRIA